MAFEPGPGPDGAARLARQRVMRWQAGQAQRYAPAAMHKSAHMRRDTLAACFQPASLVGAGRRCLQARGRGGLEASCEAFEAREL